jgi:nitrate/nitrite-specific signal transduction histidine kinase
MIILYFFYGLFFEGLGLTAWLQMRAGGEFRLRKQLPWLAAFGFTYGAAGWLDMFLASGVPQDLNTWLTVLRMILHPMSGLLLLIFGWGVLTQLTPLPSWTIFIPGVLIVPLAFVITYAATTFITPSPIEIPIDIWSRYLLYLPGSIMAGLGFLRQWSVQRKLGFQYISNLMLGAGLAFIFEAFIVGLVVPAAPYGPASYYNYDRDPYNAFIGEQASSLEPFALIEWLDYQHILQATGLPVQFWRLISAAAVTFFVIRSLGVFDALRKQQLNALQNERDRAQQAAFEAQIAARQTAESWTEALVSINRRIAELQDTDAILMHIVENARNLLKSSYMAIGVLKDDSFLELKCHSSELKTEMVEPARLVQNQVMQEVILNNLPYRSSEHESLERLSGLCPSDDGSTSMVAIVPLTLDNNPIGALWISRCSPEPYSETDLIWLECMADQVVIAIQHGLMTSQLQSLSVVEERARIAREMHDGLAQVLGYLNLQIQTLDVLLQKGKMDSLSKELRHLREAVQTAHADVRENILSLRTTLAHETGLVSAMEEYIDEFSIQTGIEVQLFNQAGEELELSSIAEVQLVCILQEALTNVRKHAKAAHVAVRVAREEGNGQPLMPATSSASTGANAYIHVSVEDDGKGFDPNTSKRSFGLQTMLERAQSVGGDLVVSPSNGRGTRVELRLPCLHQEAVSRPSLVLS